MTALFFRCGTWILNPIYVRSHIDFKIFFFGHVKESQSNGRTNTERVDFTDLIPIPIPLCIRQTVYRSTQLVTLTDQPRWSATHLVACIFTMSRFLISLALVSLLCQSDCFKHSSFGTRSFSKRVAALADFSALHDTGILTSSIDAIHHVVSGLHTDVHALHSSFNLADADVVAQVPDVAAAPVSPYTKVDKTGFIGTVADVMERAIDLSHDLMQKLGVKDTYGYSIILLTIFSKFIRISFHLISFFLRNIDVFYSPYTNNCCHFDNYFLLCESQKFAILR